MFFSKIKLAASTKKIFKISFQILKVKIAYKLNIDIWINMLMFLKTSIKRC